MSFDNLEKNLYKLIIILLLLFKKIQLDEKCVCVCFSFQADDR